MKVWKVTQYDRNPSRHSIYPSLPKCNFVVKEADIGSLRSQAQASMANIKVMPEFETASGQPQLTALVTALGWTIAQQDRPHTSPFGIHGISTEPVNLLPAFKDERKQKGSMGFKAFKRAKKDGVIVLQPRLSAKFECYDAPIYYGGRKLANFPEIRVGYNNGTYQATGHRCSGNIVTGVPGFDGDFLREAIVTNRWNQYGLQYSYVTGEWWEVDGHTSVFTLYGRPNVDELYARLQALEPPPNLLNEGLDEAYGGVYDILTELGELPETISYVYSILRRIVLLFMGLKSKEAAARTKFHGKELADEIASLWMQFRYAVSPLAYSVEDILSYRDARFNSYVTVRKRKDNPFREEVGRYLFEGSAEHRVFVKCRVKADAYTNQLGINPLKTLWELTPLSFVVDWVLPIGQLLGALLPPSNAQQIAVMRSVRVRSVKVTCDGHEVPASLDFYFARPINAIPNPLTVDVNLTWKRVVDALALSWSLFIKQHLK